jgi:uncharacterized protein YigA (DUF484 family)
MPVFPEHPRIAELSFPPFRALARAMRRGVECRAIAPACFEFLAARLPHQITHLTTMTSSLDSNAVAQYLADNAHFFEEHADVLAKLRLNSPLGGRTVSLQDRQIEVLRDKIKVLELRLADLMHLAQENDNITRKLQEWNRLLLLARNDIDLPHALINGLQTVFGVPHATLRIWGVAPDYAHTWFAVPVSDDARIFTGGLTAPFCGENHDFEAASWLEDAPSVKSIAMLALRVDAHSEAFGLLVLGSPDPQRFTSDMATDFLARMGESASAALSCFLDE